MDAATSALPPPPAIASDASQRIASAIILVALILPTRVTLEIVSSFFEVILVIACAQLICVLLGFPRLLEQSMRPEIFAAIIDTLVDCVIRSLSLPVALLRWTYQLCRRSLPQ